MSGILPGRILAAPEHHLTSPPNAGRRQFLHGVAASVAVTGGVAFAAAARNAAAEDASNLPPNVPDWSKTLGAPILASPYGVPSRYVANVTRRESPGLTRTPYSSVAFTPLQNLFGIITP